MPTSPHERSIRPPHPLAVDLAERLRGVPHPRVLDYCTGSGRNARWLEGMGFSVVAVPDEEVAAFDRSAPDATFAGVVSSHGLLHGRVSTMPERIARLSECIEPGGWMCATFASHRDARFGTGVRIEDATFAAEGGDEPGVAHAYYDEASLRALLAPQFEIVLLQEVDATKTAGGWAHAQPLTGAVHWFFTGNPRERRR